MTQTLITLQSNRQRLKMPNVTQSPAFFVCSWLNISFDPPVCASRTRCSQGLHYKDNVWALTKKSRPQLESQRSDLGPWQGQGSQQEAGVGYTCLDWHDHCKFLSTNVEYSTMLVYKVIWSLPLTIMTELRWLCRDRWVLTIWKQLHIIHLKSSNHHSNITQGKEA